VILHEPLSNIRPVSSSSSRRANRKLNSAVHLQVPLCGKIVIAVSDGVDPHNADTVFWSLAHR
jgi:hypothetical protein